MSESPRVCRSSLNLLYPEFIGLNMKPSNKWRKTAEVYKFFARNHPMVDFSEESALKMYQAESLGGKYKFPYYELSNNTYNGYAVGKHLMDMHLKMWREDIRDCFLLK